MGIIPPPNPRQRGKVDSYTFRFFLFSPAGGGVRRDVRRKGGGIKTLLYGNKLLSFHIIALLSSNK